MTLSSFLSRLTHLSHERLTKAVEQTVRVALQFNNRNEEYGAQSYGNNIEPVGFLNVVQKGLLNSGY